MDIVKFNEEVSAGSQPELSDLAQLKSDGFRSVVNLRVGGEEDQPLDPEDERQHVEKLGMNYLHFPVRGDELESQRIAEFHREYAALPKPVFVHCRRGSRAGAMVTAEWGAQRGFTGKLALEQAAGMGFTCKSESLCAAVADYCDGQAPDDDSPQLD